MVQKIKKKVKRGPKAPHAVPLAIALTALYGFQREGRDFRRTFEDPAKLRGALRLHLEEEVIPADRVLSFREYRDWGLKASPGRLAEMFSRSGVIPMGPALEEDPGTTPRLGILPIIAVVQERRLDRFSETINREWPEVVRVAFQNSVFTAFNLIPGYDLLLYAPTCAARDLNRAIGVLNHMTEEAYHLAGKAFPDPFPPFSDETLLSIPIQESFSR